LPPAIYPGWAASIRVPVTIPPVRRVAFGDT
jgi:hypothetical protein